MEDGVAGGGSPPVILIAPNVSEQMGGEGSMALLILEGLIAKGIDAHQITHARCRPELERRLPGYPITYVSDSRIDRMLHRIGGGELALAASFTARAGAIARRMARAKPGVVVHFTSPVSPVSPRFPIAGVPVIIGPIDGNIHHPPAFRHRESRGDRARRVLLGPAQRLLRMVAPGARRADAILVDGGERTRRSLRLAGCRDAQFRQTLCAGIPDRLRGRPPIEHRGANHQFIYNGRLVPHKGVDLAIKALARTRTPATLHVIGRGPARPELARLVEALGLGERVRFTEWLPDPADLDAELRKARGYVIPSFLDAHGIVVQEAMMIGLPVICLDWAGPSLLVTPENGFLAPVDSEESAVAAIAGAMDRLAADEGLARRMSRAGRRIAEDRGFAWSDVLDGWIDLYREIAPTPAPPIGAERARRAPSRTRANAAAEDGTVA